MHSEFEKKKRLQRMKHSVTGLASRSLAASSFKSNNCQPQKHHTAETLSLIRSGFQLRVGGACHRRLHVEQLENGARQFCATVPMCQTNRQNFFWASEIVSRKQK